MPYRNIITGDVVKISIVIHEDVELSDDRAKELAKNLLWNIIENNPENKKELNYAEDKKGQISVWLHTISRINNIFHVVIERKE